MLMNLTKKDGTPVTVNVMSVAKIEPSVAAMAGQGEVGGTALVMLHGLGTMIVKEAYDAVSKLFGAVDLKSDRESAEAEKNEKVSQAAEEQKKKTDDAAKSKSGENGAS